MKNSTKRTLAAISAASMLMSSGIIAANSQEPDSVPIQELTDVKAENYTISHNYIVGSMTVGKSEENNAFASDDNQLYLYKNEETLVLGSDGSKKSLDDVKEGQKIAYYADCNKPTTLQLPVHYTPDVIVILDGESSLEVIHEIGVFNEELVNEENTLQLNIGEDTLFYNTDKDSFSGGKALVLYDISTRSIPAITTPIAVVKLADDAKPEQPESSEQQTVDLSNVKNIVIGDKTFNHVPVTVNKIQMLPVRQIAEALGYTVEWVNETKTVYVGKAFFDIDKDSYTIGRMMPQSLGQASILLALPEERFATTYVPVAFFTEILGHEIKVDGETASIQTITPDEEPKAE